MLTDLPAMPGNDSIRRSALYATVPRSLLILEGVDAFDFLHRMTTNDIRTIQDGAAVRSVVVNEKGRVIDVVTVTRSGPRAVVLGSPGRSADLANWFDRFIIMEDVRIAAALEYPGLPAVYGPRAHEIARRDVSPFRCVPEDLGRIPGYIAIPLDPRADETAPAIPGAFDTVERIDVAALEPLRIEELVPAPGREFGPDFNALEAGLKSFISFSKGCYIGQEVIARLDTYGKLRTIIALFAIEAAADHAPAPGILFQEGREAGRMTSTAYSARRGGWIGLGFRQIRTGNPEFVLERGAGAPSTRCTCISDLPPGYEAYEIER